MVIEDSQWGVRTKYSQINGTEKFTIDFFQENVRWKDSKSSQNGH